MDPINNRVNRRHLSSSSSSSSSDEEPEIYLRRTKLYRSRKNRFEEYDDVDFFVRFRLTKRTVELVLHQIENLIKLPTNRYIFFHYQHIEDAYLLFIHNFFRGGCILPRTQLLLTLRFFATGSMLITMGDFMGVSKSSASRIIKRVSAALVTLCPDYIKMYNNEAEMQRSAEHFYNLASFPRVIGAIDCTLIRIQSPGGADAEIYRCRKGYFALNVQTVSDASLRIRNIVCRWPGSTHDMTIFNNSSLKRSFETGRYGRYLLIGDSGYPVLPYLMTKLQEARTPAENLYNESLIRTRNVVERQYGVWKRRFAVLSAGIRLKVDTARRVIIAAAVLHNLAVDMNDHFPEEWFADDIFEENHEEPHEANHEPNEARRQHNGRQTRQLIINNHFARL